MGSKAARRRSEADRLIERSKEFSTMASTTTTTRRTPTVKSEDVTILGKTGGIIYGSIDGHEYLIDGALSFNEAAPATVRPGEIRIVSEVTEYLDGTPMIHRETRRGREVPTGTYAAEVAKRADKRDRQAKASEPKPIDRLVGIGRKQPFAMPSSSRAASAGVIGLPSLAGDSAPRGYAIGQPARRGPGQLAEWLNARGFSLSLTPAGKLMVRSPGGRWPTDEERRAYIDGAPLLSAWLAGRPLICELFHKDPVEAVTVVDLNIVVCEEHAA